MRADSHICQEKKKKKIVVFKGLRDLTSSELHEGVKSQKVNLFKLGFNSTGDLNPSRQGYYQIDIINFEITNYSKIESVFNHVKLELIV